LRRDGFDYRQDVVVDSSRIRAELGYAEQVEFDETLRRTVAWERANPPVELKPEDYDYGAEDAALAARAPDELSFESSWRLMPEIQPSANGTLVGRETQKRISYRYGVGDRVEVLRSPDLLDAPSAVAGFVGLFSVRGGEE
jgi:hypothetical protein